MRAIDITAELERFDTHLENNPRTIFSAKFGDGKTYFLKKYMERHEKDTMFIVLHPINYAVAANEDVFEYIKRDILLKLSKEPEFKEVNWKEVISTILDYDNLLETNEAIADAMPDGLVIKPVAKMALIPFKWLKKVDDKFAIDKFFSRFEEARGCIYEQDHFTVAIRATIEKIQAKGKKCVLLIEDLDRVDPAHLFRILNVFGAHIDDDANSNKFGFDNIVAILDYRMTEHIFKHFYGESANYEGYMSKFTSHNIFDYSITREAIKMLLDYLRIECHISDADLDYTWHSDGRLGVSSIKRKLEKLSVRDVVNVLDDIDKQYVNDNIQLGHYTINPQEPIVKLLALLTRLNILVDQKRLIEYLHQNTEHYALLGAFTLSQPEITHKMLEFHQRSIIILTEEKDGITTVKFSPILSGVIGRYEEKTPLILGEVYKCVHDCLINEN